jgi:hypothetical protein
MNRNHDIQNVCMLQAVDQKERALWEKGAAWEPPSISGSLRGLPLFADLPDSLFQEIILEVLAQLIASLCAQHHLLNLCCTVLASRLRSSLHCFAVSSG